MIIVIAWYVVDADDADDVVIVMIVMLTMHPFRDGEPFLLPPTLGAHDDFCHM